MNTHDRNWLYWSAKDPVLWLSLMSLFGLWGSKATHDTRYTPRHRKGRQR